MTYQVGDTVYWGTPITAGEYTFIGHPRGDKAGKVLVLAHSAEIGFEVDADECAPTGLSNPQRVPDAERNATTVRTGRSTFLAANGTPSRLAWA